MKIFIFSISSVLAICLWVTGHVANTAAAKDTKYNFASAKHHNATFKMCSPHNRQTCVVDGDTFWLNGIKIRIADIDAPETHRPRCAYEAERGKSATKRLLRLLNQGTFTLISQQRSQDIYGRQLRVVMRDGRSLGAILIDEKLARKWGSWRQSWCV